MDRVRLLVSFKAADKRKQTRRAHHLHSGRRVVTKGLQGGYGAGQQAPRVHGRQVAVDGPQRQTVCTLGSRVLLDLPCKEGVGTTGLAPSSAQTCSCCITTWMVSVTNAPGATCHVRLETRESHWRARGSASNACGVEHGLQPGRGGRLPLRLRSASAGRRQPGPAPTHPAHRAAPCLCPAGSSVQVNLVGKTPCVQ